jgi:hypothetical protein
MTSTQTTMDEDVQPASGPTVGTKEGLGAGVIALGFLALILPWASNAIVDSTSQGDPYTILTGSVMVLGLFIVAAGIAIILAKLDNPA